MIIKIFNFIINYNPNKNIFIFYFIINRFFFYYFIVMDKIK